MDLKFRLIQLEQSLIQTDTRRNLKLLDELLADDFLEIPASGVPFDKSSALARIPNETPPSFSQWDFQLKQLAPDAAALIYRAAIQQEGEEPVYSMRCSIWKLTPAGWRMTLHQGTPCPAPAKPA